MPHHSGELLDVLCVAPTCSGSLRRNISESTARQWKVKFPPRILGFSTTKLDGTSVICLSVPQSTLGSVSECLWLRLYAAVQTGQELPVSSLSSSCSAMGSTALLF